MNEIKGVKGTAELSLEVGWRVTFYGMEVILGLKLLRHHYLVHFIVCIYSIQIHLLLNLGP